MDLRRRKKKEEKGERKGGEGNRNMGGTVNTLSPLGPRKGKEKKRRRSTRMQGKKTIGPIPSATSSPQEKEGEEGCWRLLTSLFPRRGEGGLISPDSIKGGGVHPRASRKFEGGRKHLFLDYRGGGKNAASRVILLVGRKNRE